MDFNSILENFHIWWNDVCNLFGSVSTLVLTDIETILIYFGVFILCAIVVYLISILSMRERTYEEALEEQRRRNQEAIQQAKSDKSKKDKKFKKWGKKKDKTDEDKNHTTSNDMKLLQEPSDVKMETENQSTNQSEAKSKKKSKQRKPIVEEKAENSQQPSSSEETDEPISSSSAIGVQSLESTENKKQLSETCSDSDLVNKNFDTSPELENEVKEKVAEIDATKAQTSRKSPTKKFKKSKLDSRDSSSELGDWSENKIISIIKSATLSEEEVDHIMEVLYKKGSLSEKKRNDMIASLKKQIQDKEDGLKAERKLCQAANDKISELVQEMSEEKAQAMTCEKSLRDVLNQEQQEIKALHGMMQRKREQHASELSAMHTKMQQMKNKMKEEHTLTIQRLQEENNQLQTLNRVESEKQQRSNMEVSRMQHELEQLRSSRDNHKAASQQLEKHMEQQEYSYKQRLNECQEEAARKLQLLQQDNGKFIDREEHESIVQEKECLLHGLVQQLDHCKCEIVALAKEVELQKQQNKELNAKKGEAARAAEDLVSKAELRVAEAQRKADSRTKEMQNILNEQIKEVERAVQESYCKELEAARLEADQRISAAEAEANLKIEEFQESLYARIREVNSEAEATVTQAILEKEQMKSELDNLGKMLKESLKRIFPSFVIDDSLNHKDWLNQYEAEAKLYFQKVKEDIDPSLVKKQLEETAEEKSKLKSQVQNYETVLAETECMLRTLQNNIENEEKKWQAEMLLKEQDLKKVLYENEKLQLHNKTLEASLEQLQGLKETLYEVEELRLKLQKEEMEKKILQERLADSLPSSPTISMCTNNGQPTEVNSNHLPNKSEKRKKSKKRGASGKK